MLLDKTLEFSNFAIGTKTKEKATTTDAPHKRHGFLNKPDITHLSARQPSICNKKIV